VERLSSGQRLIKVFYLFGASIFVHLWLLVASRIFADARPFGDLSLYNYWSYQVNQGMPIYGLETDWVYPALAFIPVWIPSLFENYEAGWLLLILLLNTAVALALEFRYRNHFFASHTGWLFLLLLALLGPVAISRIDSVSVAVALLGLLAIGANRLTTAATFLTLAGWIKIWPVAVFLGLIASFKERLKPLIAATAISLSIVVVGFTVGGFSVFSFITTQQDRGLQIESVMATFWMWLASAGLAEIYFDDEILTNQVRGPFVAELAASANFLLLLAISIVFALALRAIRKGQEPRSVFVFASLAGVAALIVFNKVGSPQFMLWLVVPIVAGYYFKIPKVWPVIAAGLVTNLLTQLVYPVFYIELLSLQFGPLALLTLRNSLVIGLMIYGLLGLTRKQSLKQFSNLV
jgi:hypothetical protein